MLKFVVKVDDVNVQDFLRNACPVPVLFADTPKSVIISVPVPFIRSEANKKRIFSSVASG